MRFTISLPLCLVVVALPIAAAVASQRPATVHKVYVSRATVHLRSGAFDVVATRRSNTRIQVTTVFRVTATRPTNVSWVVGICTKGGCVDAGSKSTGPIPVAPGRRTISRMVTVQRTGGGAAACVTMQPMDDGPTVRSRNRLIKLRGGTPDGAMLCPAL
jgi:hypothetical protein